MIYLSLPPTRQDLLKVNDSKVDDSECLGQGKVEHEPRIEPCYDAALRSESGQAEARGLCWTDLILSLYLVHRTSVY